MKLKNIGKRITALLACCLVCVVTASAVIYSKWTDPVTGKNNIKYYGRTAITPANGMVSSTATVMTTDGTKVPAGYVKAYATLERGDILAAHSEEEKNGALSTGITVTTNQASGAGTYTSGGTGWFMNKSGELEQFQLTSTSYTMSRSNNNESEFTNEEETRSGYDVSELSSEELLLLCQDDEFLSQIDGTEINGVWFSNEDMQIHTNENGNTYGGFSFARCANLDVDLVAAEGKNGVVGYVWRSSLPGAPGYVRVGHPYEIPVYASDGVTVLDSFVIASANSVNIDATE